MNYLALGGSSEEDGGDFLSGGGGQRSNLNNLFGLNAQMSSGPSNQSLTYKAPKPPGKQNEPQPSQAATSGVAIAVAVTAFRLVNNQYNKQGRLGAAILRNPSANDYKILMYVTKQKPVSTCQITTTFHFTVQANNYVSFTDDQKQTWSVLFENNQQQVDFAKQICLAKYMSTGNAATESVSQDLTPRDASAATETGDSLEVKYSGWLLSADGTLGAVFDSNHNNEKTFRFKTGKGKVIKGWESGMLGMQKGGKRFIVIPPQLAYGQKQVGSRVPANSTLVFEVDLLRLKKSKDSSSVKSSGSNESVPLAATQEQLPSIPSQAASPFPGMPSPAITQTSTVPHQHDQLPAGPPTVQFYNGVLGFKRLETPQFPFVAQWLEMTDGTKLHIVEPAKGSIRIETVKGRTASLNDQISQVTGDASKTDLVSRMARMGHAMLPGMSADPQQIPQHQANPAPAQVEMTVPGGAVMNHEVPVMMTSSGVNPLPANSPLHHAPSPHPQVYNNVGSFNPHRPSTPTYHVTPQHAQMQMTSQNQNMHMTSQNQNMQMTSQNQNMQMAQQYQTGLQGQYLDTQQGIPSQTNIQSTLEAPQQQYASYSNYRPPQHYNPSPTHGSDFFPILITESRQQSSELRSLQEKVDKVTVLVDEVKKITSNETQQGGNTTQTMEANQIMHSVQRILQENERLKDQLLDKTKQIETQNDKISELLQQNQKHVEKSNLILEQRNDTFKESFQQSQARSLLLEQDKVQLTEKLSDATSRISELTQDLSNAKQREGELKQKFKDIYMKEKERADDAEEKVKELEDSLSSAQENEASREKNEESYNSRIREMKQKMQEILDEKNTRIQELTESLGQREMEITELKNKMDLTVEGLQVKIENLSENSTTVASHSTQLKNKNEVLQMEVSTLRQSAQEFVEGQKELENKLEISVQRFGQLRNAYEEQRGKLEEMNEELDEANLYKERFERLKTQATSMKQRYDEKISQLQTELEEQEASPPPSHSSSNPDQLIAEVKKIMNSIFQRVKSQISADEEYEGSEILNIMVQIIKTTTLELINAKNDPNPQPEEAESHKSSSDEEETPDEPKPMLPGKPPSEVRTEAEQTVTQAEPVKDKVCTEPEHQDPTDAEPRSETPVNSGEPEQEPNDVESEPDQSEDKKEESAKDSDDEDATSPAATDLEEKTNNEEKSIAEEASNISETPDTEIEIGDEKSRSVSSASNDDVSACDVQGDVIDTDVPADPLQAETGKTDEDKEEEKFADPLSEPADEKTPQELNDDAGDEDEAQKVATVESGGDTEKLEGKSDGENPVAEKAKEESQSSMNQMITDTILNQIRVGREQSDDVTSLSRSSSVLDDRQPPPLFDDDDSDEDDLDWLK